MLIAPVRNIFPLLRNHNCSVLGRLLQDKPMISFTCISIMANFSSSVWQIWLFPEAELGVLEPAKMAQVKQSSLLSWGILFQPEINSSSGMQVLVCTTGTVTVWGWLTPPWAGRGCRKSFRSSQLVTGGCLFPQVAAIPHESQGPVTLKPCQGHLLKALDVTWKKTPKTKQTACMKCRIHS